MSAPTIQIAEEMMVELCRKWKIRELAVFGSILRDDFRPESDIDLLVELESGRSLLDHAALLVDLQELLGRHVDVVTENAMYWLLRRRILKEAKPL